MSSVVYSPDTNSSSNSSTTAISVVVTLVIFIVIGAISCCFARKAKQCIVTELRNAVASSASNVAHSTAPNAVPVWEIDQPTMEKFIKEMAEQRPIRFTAHQLYYFTGNYSTPLGAGGFGTVYKGEFPNGVKIAVKVLKRNSEKRAEEQFMNEDCPDERPPMSAVVKMLEGGVEIVPPSKPFLYLDPTPKRNSRGSNLQQTSSSSDYSTSNEDSASYWYKKTTPIMKKYEIQIAKPNPSRIGPFRIYLFFNPSSSPLSLIACKILTLGTLAASPKRIQRRREMIEIALLCQSDWMFSPPDSSFTSPEKAFNSMIILSPPLAPAPHVSLPPPVIWEADAPTMEKFFREIAEEKPVRFTAPDLYSFTSNYSTRLGSGGFGEVYKGQFPNGVNIAVKVLKKSSDKRAEEQFMAEVGSICRTYHINLVWDAFEKGVLDELVVGCGIGEGDRERASRACVVALWCVQDAPDERPRMSAVVKMLEGGVDIVAPPKPFQYLNPMRMGSTSGSSGSSEQTKSGSSQNSTATDTNSRWYRNTTTIMRKYEIQMASS
ncbi:Rust resistance kinase Lr10, partial [Cucurbita argyrosperma subsp. argyrosperma]